MAVLVAFFAGTSLLLSILAIPLILVRVKPNSWYGFRILLTMNNPEIWFPANKFTGKWLLSYGIIL